jgi:hypothetical protein
MFTSLTLLRPFHGGLGSEALYAYHEIVPRKITFLGSVADI